MAGKNTLSNICLLLHCLFVYVYGSRGSVHIGVIVTKPPHYFSEVQTKPALDMAVQRIHDMVLDGRLSRNISMTYIMKATLDSCDGFTAMVAPALATEFKYIESVTAIFGPSCSEEMERVADLAAYWSLAVITASAVDIELDNKERYSTVIRAFYRASQYLSLFKEVFNLFQWTRGSMVFQTCCIFRNIGESVEKSKELGESEELQLFSFDGEDEESLYAALSSAAKVSRGESEST